MWLYLPTTSPTASTASLSAPGGGGLDLGVELALPAARSVVMVEREAFSVAHLVAAIEQGLLAPAVIWSDVRSFDGRPWRGLVDFLIGGIPCQPHSLAGKKRGSFDERDLWSPTRRIIVQARPWFGLIENVRGMLSAGADEVAGAQRVLGDLRKLGYTVECGLFTAAETGASHLRPRLFILFVANTDGNAVGRHDRSAGFPGSAGETQGAPQGADGQRSGPGPRHGREDVANAECDGWGQGDAGTEIFGRASEPDAGSDGALADTGSPRQQGRAATRFAGPGRQGSAAERNRSALADARGDGCRTRIERDVGTSGKGGRAFPSTPSRPLEQPDGIGRTRVIGRPGAKEFIAERGFAPGWADIEEGYPALYPPGPSDLDGWRRVLAHSPDLEPSVRRMADGVAARLDLSGPHAARVDRLRLLGNGVVCLEGAYAFRTLVTRLAGTGHAGAVELARLMEAAV